MWLSLKVENETRLALVNRQLMKPSWGGPDSALLVTTTALLEQFVSSFTNTTAKLRYIVREFTAELRTSQHVTAPKAWLAPEEILGSQFHITITPQGALTLLGSHSNLSPEAQFRLSSLSEDIRSCWVVPPTGAGNGSEWTYSITPPKPVPNDCTTHHIHSTYRLAHLDPNEAKIEGRFTAVTSRPNKRQETTGTLLIELDKVLGINKATRISKMQSKHHTRKARTNPRSELLIQRL